MARRLILFLKGTALSAADWPMFRGVNGLVFATVTKGPTEFGPSKNVVWKTSLPFGHSSPAIIGGLIFLIGAEGGDKVVDQGGKLFTL